MRLRSSLWLAVVLSASAELPEPYARGNQALELLRASKTPDATTILESLLHTPAEEMAKRWLTRLDREQVKTQLRAIYRQRIEYPFELPVAIKPPTDRWGKAWVYRSADLARVGGVKRQSYTLESSVLGKTSDLKTALKKAASTPSWKIVSADKEVVNFERPDTPQPAMLSVGATLDRVTLLQIGEKEVLLTDGDQFFTVPLPEK